MNGVQLLLLLEGYINFKINVQSSYIINELSYLQLLAHEIGHNLGFYHDFDNHHGGQSSSCNQNNHIMSYGSSKDKWSTCSKKDFEARYLWVKQTSYVSWCMEGNIINVK